MPGPDGAFAPSETFSPNLPVPINGRPRIKRSGRGACPVPPRGLGLLAMAGRGIRPVRNVFPEPAGSNQRSATDQTFGTGRMPRPAAVDGAYPVRLEVQSWAGRGIRPVRNVFSEPAGSNQRSATDQTFGTGRMPRPAAVDGANPVRLGIPRPARYPVRLGYPVRLVDLQFSRYSRCEIEELFYGTL